MKRPILAQTLSLFITFALILACGCARVVTKKDKVRDSVGARSATTEPQVLSQAEMAAESGNFEGIRAPRECVQLFDVEVVEDYQVERTSEWLWVDLSLGGIYTATSLALFLAQDEDRPDETRQERIAGGIITLALAAVFWGNAGMVIGQTHGPRIESESYAEQRWLVSSECAGVESGLVEDETRELAVETPAESVVSRAIELLERPEAASTPTQVLTLEQAAELCRLDPSVIEAWIEQGDLKALKLDADYRISRTELEKTWSAKGGGEL